MKFSDQSYNLRIELDTQNCQLSAGEIETFEDDLDTLRVLVEDFPISDLHITVVHHGRSDDYHVKTTLSLPGRKLFTGDRHALVHPAFESCVRKLVKKVRAYKSQMRVGTERSRTTIAPTRDMDVEILTTAAATKHYSAFRREIDVFEPAMNERIGRWIERYPNVRRSLGTRDPVSDIVEEVFLNAFQWFANRPRHVEPGQWLESLIDPAVQALLRSPEAELERVTFSKSTVEA